MGVNISKRYSTQQLWIFVTKLFLKISVTVLTKVTYRNFEVSNFDFFFLKKTWEWKFQNATHMVNLFQPNFIWMFHVTVLTEDASWNFWNFKFNLNNLMCPMEKWKIVNISEIASLRVKPIKIWDSWKVITCIQGTFGHFSVQCHLGVIRCTCLRMACNSETVGCRAKRGWNSGLVGSCNIHV